MSEKNESARWVERDHTAIAGFARIPYFPLVFESGRGAELTDVDGKTYIDLLASAGSQNIGYAHPAVTKAVTEQMNRYAQFTNSYFYNPRAAQLAERLIEISPGKGPKKVAFGATGSDAIDGAIKLAKGFTGRNKLICFEGSYHGSTFGALSVSTVSPGLRRKLGTLLPDVHVMPFPNPYRDGERAAEQCLEVLERAFRTWLPPQEVAAILIESIQGDGGLIVPPQAFLDRLVTLCREYGILLIDDEVQQGCMRTGKWFGIENFGIEPDIICMGKALGAGLPQSAIIARSEIMDSLMIPAHAFTMAGNATCAAAALAMLDVLGAPGFREDMMERAGYMKQRLQKLAQKHQGIGEVRGLGFSIGVEMVKNRQTREADPVTAKKICYQGWQKGIVMICLTGNVLRIQPPLVITREQIDRAVDIIDECMTDCETGLVSDEVAEQVRGW